MQSLSQLLEQPWFSKLPSDLQNLISMSVKLYVQEEEYQNSFSDYSFVIFPMSKAYEGFLKEYLLKKGLIDKQTYEGHRFRIGRALNPDLRNYYRDEQWLYDDLVKSCGQETARQVWEVWLKCRNRVFHFFPGEIDSLSLAQAGEYIGLMISVIIKMMPCLEKNKKESHDRQKNQL